MEFKRQRVVARIQQALEMKSIELTVEIVVCVRLVDQLVIDLVTETAFLFSTHSQSQEVRIQFFIGTDIDFTGDLLARMVISVVCLDEELTTFKGSLAIKLLRGKEVLATLDTMRRINLKQIGLAILNGFTIHI